LLQSLPQIGRGERLIPITGNVPSPHERPRGCSFAPRCPHVMDNCHTHDPPSFQLDAGTQVACWLYQEEAVHEQLTT
jgi:peptide/nickel transport system ATP-binding protein